MLGNCHPSVSVNLQSAPACAKMPDVSLPAEIRTERLLLRRWRPADRDAYARMNSNPRAMKYFPGLISRPESDALFDRIQEHFRAHGFGRWAVEITGVAPFAGSIGLIIPAFEAPFTPCVEVGWRLDPAYWGHGYATEAAAAALAFGFNEVGLNEIVSFTVPHNIPSRRVMEKLGMTHDPGDDFDHPLLPVGGPLRHHVLYRKLRTGLPSSP